MVHFSETVGLPKVGQVLCVEPRLFEIYDDLEDGQYDVTYWEGGFGVRGVTIHPSILLVLESDETFNAGKPLTQAHMDADMKEQFVVKRPIARVADLEAAVAQLSTNVTELSTQVSQLADLIADQSTE